MMAGLTRQALRSNPWSFFGPASTQALAATIVTGALGVQASTNAAHLDPATQAALADSGILDVAVIFVMISIYLTMIIVGVTMGATIARQARDIALVRAVGGTPGRVRGAVALQAVMVAVPATIVGVPLGMLGGRAWLHGLVTHGIVPGTVTFHPSPTAPAIALAITAGTSLIGALFAAIRPSRVKPSVALTEAAAPGRRIGRIRTVLGLILVAGGVVLSFVISGLGADQADQGGLFVMIAMCVGAGLLGPALLRVAAPFARLLGPPGRLAADNLAVRAKSYSGALVPLTLAAAFAGVNVARLTTTAHVTGTSESPADLWLEYSGTFVYTAFAAVAALNTLITVVLSRRRDLAVVRLAGATRAHALSVVICEALTVTGTGLVVAAAVAATTLLPLLHTALGTWTPWMPAGYWLTGVFGVTALVLAGTAIPAALAMRQPAIEAVT
jgi:putative ABC transport system permease protein